MRGVRYRRVRGPARPTPPAARAPGGAPAAVLWSGPWAGIGALPRVSRETVAALRGLGIPVQAAGESRERRGLYARRRSLRHVAVHVQWLPAGFWRAFQPSTRKVAYTFCESTSLPVAPRRLLLPDLIVVPSTFCADVFRAALDGWSGAPRVAVVPHGATPGPAFVPPPADGPTVFLSVAAPGRRKGRDLLAAAFPRAFPEARDVELWLAGGASYPGRHPGLRFLGEVPDDALLRAMERAHCLVFPARGEGFCLPALEGGALGRPCIITDWSGPRDFVDEQVGYLVAVERLVPRDDGGLGAGLWAEPNLDSLIEALRAVARDRATALEKGRRFRERVRAAWTWDHAAARLAAETGLLPPLRPTPDGTP